MHLEQKSLTDHHEQSGENVTHHNTDAPYVFWDVQYQFPKAIAETI